MSEQQKTAGYKQENAMQHYRDWPLMDSLPAGWSFSKAAGSPLTGYAFAMSGSPLRGGRTALVRVREPQMQLLLSEPVETLK